VRELSLAGNKTSKTVRRLSSAYSKIQTRITTQRHTYSEGLLCIGFPSQWHGNDAGIIANRATITSDRLQQQSSVQSIGWYSISKLSKTQHWMVVFDQCRSLPDCRIRYPLFYLNTRCTGQNLKRNGGSATA
jgi:hypothetical protein